MGESFCDKAVSEPLSQPFSSKRLGVGLRGGNDLCLNVVRLLRLLRVIKARCRHDRSFLDHEFLEAVWNRMVHGQCRMKSIVHSIVISLNIAVVGGKPRCPGKVG